MLISSNISNDGKTQTIIVAGQFDVELAVEFKKMYREVPSTVRNYVIDVEQVYLIDASSMVMMLIMREEKGRLANISLVNCNKDVIRMIEIYRLHKLINVSSKDDVDLDSGFDGVKYSNANLVVTA